MTITLGALELSDHLTLDIQAVPAAATQTWLIGGAPVLQSDGSSGGRTLVLNSERHLLVSQFDVIKAMQASGLPIMLIHPRFSGYVVVTDTSQISEDNPRVDPDNDATLTCSGDITMIEV